MAFLVECGQQIAIAGASIGVSASIVLLLEVCVLTVQCANDLGAPCSNMLPQCSSSET